MGLNRITRWIEIGRNGHLQVANPVGSGRHYPLDYNIIEWNVRCRHRRRLVDGLKCDANKNNEFKVAKSVGGELCVLISKWDLRREQKRSAMRKKIYSAIPGIPVLEWFVEPAVGALYHFWVIRLTLGKKELLHSGWKVVDSVDITIGEGASISWDYLGHMMKNYFKL